MGDTMTGERIYTTIDKATWGPGPWANEPDKIQWTDQATGSPCLIVRGPSGALCGYVGVEESHPWFRREYGASLCGHPGCYAHTIEGTLDVHGGVTYSAPCQEGGDECASVCHIPEPGKPDHVWWFGFDCAHAGDFSPGSAALLRSYPRLYPGDDLGVQRDYEVYRTIAYVQAECADLARQLAAMTKEDR